MSVMKTEQAIVPSLRFPGFEGVQVKKSLGDFFIFKNGVNADKSAYGSGRKFINVLDIISDAPIISNNIIGSVKISDKEFEKNEVRYGDILFQRSSETREEVGQSNIYVDKHNTATFGGFVIRGRPIAELESQYFHYLLKTLRVRKEVTARSGGSTRYNIGQESLSVVPVSISPNILEQQKIAAFLSAVDAKIEQLSRKQTLLIEYKRGAMRQIFSQQIRFKDDQGQDFPDWEEKRLDDIAYIVGGGTPDSADPSYWNGSISWFTPTEIKTKYLKTSQRKITDQGLQASSAKLLPKGSLLLSTRATVGDIGIALEECCTNQGFQSFVVKPSNINEFWYYWINHNKRELLRRASGSTFLEIGKSEISKVPAFVPHPNEQHKIATFLASLDTKIDLISQQLESAKTFKRGLLQKMFV